MGLTYCRKHAGFHSIVPISPDLIGSECHEIIEARYGDFFAVWISPRFAREHGIRAGSFSIDEPREEILDLLVPRCPTCIQEDHPDFRFSTGAQS